MGYRAGVGWRWPVTRLLGTVEQHWLVLGMTVVMFALLMGGYYALWRLGEALDRRADRKRAAARREQEAHNHRRYVGRVTPAGPIGWGHREQAYSGRRFDG